MRPKLLLLYQHYHTPDCPGGARLYSLLHALRPHADVTLITSTARRTERLTADFPWVPDGIAIREVEVPYTNQMSTGQRLRSYLSFATHAFWIGLREASPDLVYGISTPLSTAWTAAAIACWYDVPWVFEIRDLWPAFPIQMGAVPYRWLERVLYRTEHALYQSAEHVLTVSPDMTAYVKSTGVSSDCVTTVLPGSDRRYLHSSSAPSPNQLRQHHDLSDSPFVLYAGTFGRANDIPSLIETAQRCVDTDFSFLFIGRGYYEPHLRRLSNTHPSVHLIPPQPQHYMGAWYELADVSLVPFLDLPVLASNSPAKFFDSLTMGTPVIVTNPGWTRRFVETHHCGWYVPPSDPSALATRLRSVLNSPKQLRTAGHRGRIVAREQFNRTEQFSQISSLIKHILS